MTGPIDTFHAGDPYSAVVGVSDGDLDHRGGRCRVPLSAFGFGWLDQSAGSQGLVEVTDGVEVEQPPGVGLRLNQDPGERR